MGVAELLRNATVVTGDDRLTTDFRGNCIRAAFARLADGLIPDMVATGWFDDDDGNDGDDDDSGQCDKTVAEASGVTSSILKLNVHCRDMLMTAAAPAAGDEASPIAWMASASAANLPCSGSNAPGARR